MSDKNTYYESLAEFIVNTDEYLRFLATKYPSASPSDERANSKYIKSTQFYRSSLSHQLEIINGLPDLNKPELKKMKQRLLSAIIDLQVLKHSQETFKFISDEATHKLQQRKHNTIEKWFNRIYNDSLFVLKKNDIIYCLELNTERQDKPTDTTFYNHLPENIEGTLRLYDMKMSTEKYQQLTEISSDDETEDNEQNELTSQNLIENYKFSSKTQFIDLLQIIKKLDYTPFYNLT